MTLTVTQLQSLINELPIGYYASTKVPVKVDETADTSYFVPATREIFISLVGVNKTIENASWETDEQAECTIRAHLYHELSHALLTPKCLHIDDITNIFEDERIETLLREYYMKVNFRENIKALCNYKGEKPTDDNAFFYAVRFGVGRAEWLAKIQAIITKYESLNWASKRRITWNYYWEVHRLANEIQESLANKPMTDEEWQSILSACGCGLDGSATANIDGTGGAQGEGATVTPSNATQKGKNWGRGAFEKALDNAVQTTFDKNFYQSVEQILMGFKKRNSKGAAMQGYSGYLNPRNCGREDYKFFDRRATVNGSNPYGTLHLNLFIDDSGSFESNALKANQIIATLSALADKYSFFTVDFALCGDAVERVPHSKAYITAEEGTYIQASAKDIVREMQKKGTCVYNIVLYDGNAGHDRGLSYTYEPFDYDNTTLILDTSCQRDASACKKAKVIITDDYLHNLTTHILQVMQRAFH
jgi:hypothetical protein